MYVPGFIPLMVVLVPVPLVVAPPGLAVRVQVPDAGSPVKNTLPVVTLQVGWVIVPTPGASGVTRGRFITTEPEAGEVQPSLLVTV